MVDERTTGYSIWLMPEGEVFERYNDVIAKVAKENGTPKFEAHVTLLGGIPAEVGDEMVFKKSQELAEGLRPFRITLGGYGMGHVFVQALFLHAETTVALLQAYSRARQTFGLGGPQYTPHLSMLYANLPVDQRIEISQGLPTDLPRRFRADKLYIYQTEGTVAEWRRIATFNFGKT